MPGRWTKGRLLVATPTLDDPHFARTVVLVLEHTGTGAAGVVLNRPGVDPVDTYPELAAWAAVASAPTVVFAGGPVQTDALIGLARMERGRSNDAVVEIVEGLASVDLARADEVMSAGVTALRIYRGYAGWSPGQLEAELASGSWMVLEASPTDAFSDQPRELWREVLRRQGGRLSWIAGAPEDLSNN